MSVHGLDVPVPLQGLDAEDAIGSLKTVRVDVLPSVYDTLTLERVAPTPALPLTITHGPPPSPGFAGYTIALLSVGAGEATVATNAMSKAVPGKGSLLAMWIAAADVPRE